MSHFCRDVLLAIDPDVTLCVQLLAIRPDVTLCVQLLPIRLYVTLCIELLPIRLYVTLCIELFPIRQDVTLCVQLLPIRPDVTLCPVVVQPFVCQQQVLGVQYPVHINTFYILLTYLRKFVSVSDKVRW